jgi:hypothetical protein
MELPDPPEVGGGIWTRMRKAWKEAWAGVSHQSTDTPAPPGTRNSLDRVHGRPPEGSSTRERGELHHANRDGSSKSQTPAGSCTRGTGKLPQPVASRARRRTRSDRKQIGLQVATKVGAVCEFSFACRFGSACHGQHGEREQELFKQREQTVSALERSAKCAYCLAGVCDFAGTGKCRGQTAMRVTPLADPRAQGDTRDFLPPPPRKKLKKRGRKRPRGRKRRSNQDGVGRTTQDSQDGIRPGEVWGSGDESWTRAGQGHTLRLQVIMLEQDRTALTTNLTAAISRVNELESQGYVGREHIAVQQCSAEANELGDRVPQAGPKDLYPKSLPWGLMRRHEQQIEELIGVIDDREGELLTQQLRAQEHHRVQEALLEALGEEIQVNHRLREHQLQQLEVAQKQQKQQRQQLQQDRQQQQQQQKQQKQHLQQLQRQEQELKDLQESVCKRNDQLVKELDELHDEQDEREEEYKNLSAQLQRQEALLDSQKGQICFYQRQQQLQQEQRFHDYREQQQRQDQQHQQQQQSEQHWQQQQQLQHQQHQQQQHQQQQHQQQGTSFVVGTKGLNRRKR